MKLLKNIAILTTTCLLAMSCEKVNDKSGEAQSAEVEVQDGAKYVDFDISTSSVAFSLNIEELSLSLVCDNFTDETTVTKIENAGSFEIYGEQTGCKVKLLSFKADGEDYTPKQGSEFVDHLVDELAIYTNGTKEVNLRIISQLPSPLLGDASVKYLMSEIISEDSDIDLDISSNDTDVGVDNEKAPQLTVNKATIKTINNEKTLSLKVECLKAVTSSDFETAECEGIKLKDLELKLILKPENADLSNVAFFNSLFEDEIYEDFSFIEANTDVPNGGILVNKSLEALNFDFYNANGEEKFLFAARKERWIILLLLSNSKQLNSRLYG